MGSRRITYLINRFHRRVYCRIKPNSKLCACNIKVDGSRHAYGIDSQMGKFLRSLERTVSADYHQPVHTVLLQDCSRPLLPFLRAHLFTPRRLKNRTSALDRIGNIPRRQINDFFIQQSLITLPDSSDSQTLAKSRTNNGTDCRIHSWRIASTG